MCQKYIGKNNVFRNDEIEEKKSQFNKREDGVLLLDSIYLFINLNMRVLDIK